MYYLVVPLIVAMSCFIAWFGDYLGRRLGKKRLSLLGMRPRHTAVVITMLTGTAIACATLGSMMLVDSEVRRALTRYPQVEADLETAKRESREWQQIAAAARLQALRDQAELVSSEKRIADLRVRETAAEQQEEKANRALELAKLNLRTGLKALAEVRARRDALVARVNVLGRVNRTQLVRLAQADARLGELQRRQSGLKVELARLSDTVQRLDIAVAVASKARKEAEDRREAVKVQLAEASSRLQVEEDRLQDAQASFAILDAKAKDLAAKVTALESVNTSLAAAKADLQKSNGDLLSRNAALQTANDSLKSANDELEGSNHSLRVVNTSLQDANTDLQSKNQQANDKLAATQYQIQIAEVNLNLLVQELRNSSHNPITFEPDQLIAQRLVDCDRPAREVVSAVFGVLDEAQSAARDAGAMDSDGDGRVLRLVDAGGRGLTHQEVMDDFIQRLSRMHGKMVVRIQAIRRFVAGDEVVAGIYSIPYRLIYRHGQVIASEVLNGHQSEKAIRNEVATFLSTKVRPSALNAGMLPDTHADISADILDKVLDLCHALHQKDRRVQVTAVAAADTWCSQPLDVTFDLE